MRSYGLLALMTAALVNGPPEAASAGSKVDRHGSVQGNPRAFTAGIDTVAAYAKETPHGDFNVENRYGGSISPAKEMPGSNKVGATEGRTMCIPHAPDKAPLPETLGLPFLPFKKFDVQRTVHEAVSLPFCYAHAADKLHEVAERYTMGMRPGTVNRLSCWA